jgi:hypothetical protein
MVIKINLYFIFIFFIFLEVPIQKLIFIDTSSSRMAIIE